MDIIPLLKSQPFINVVGNAASILDKNDGLLIDRYFTVRFNIHREVDTSKQGSRTDLLVGGQGITIPYYLKNKTNINFTNLIVKENAKKPFVQFSINNKIELYIISKNILNSAQNIYPKGKISYQKAFFNHKNIEVKEIVRTVARTKNQDPSIGFIILYYLYINNLKQINIFGFDWKETGSLHTIGEFIGPHNYAFEKEKIIEWGKELHWKFH